MLFAAILLTIAGVLNFIYGIGAISDAHFYTTTGTHYVLGSLHAWGWLTLLLGIIQLTAGFSLFSGGTYGRVFGIGAASLSMIAALLSIPAYPFWSLAIFGIDILIIYGLATYDPGEAAR